jgi:hypothetical protein
MKCPKCEFVSFDSVETCKRCGYSFVVEKPEPKRSLFSRLTKKAEKKPDKNEPEEEVFSLFDKKEPPAQASYNNTLRRESEPQASESKPAAKAPLISDDLFDEQFDGLFGGDKEPVKHAAGDTIKITAKDKYSVNQEKIEEENAKAKACDGVSSDESNTAEDSLKKDMSKSRIIDGDDDSEE